MIDAEKTLLPYLEPTEDEITVIDFGWVKGNEGVIIQEPFVEPDEYQSEIIFSDLEKFSSWILVRSGYRCDEKYYLGEWGEDLDIYSVSEHDRSIFWEQNHDLYDSKDEWMKSFSEIF